MNCPSCGNRARCLDSRIRENGSRTRRFGCCCGYLFSTAEVVLDESGTGHTALGQLAKQMADGRELELRRKIAELIGAVLEEPK